MKIKIKSLIFIFFITLLIFLNSKIFAFSKVYFNDIKFYEPQKGIYIADININKYKNCLLPYVSENLETVENIAKKTNSIIAINAGFFDPVNQKTISYVTKDGQIVADPLLNENLTTNEQLKPYLADILNRSELRILNCKEQQVKLNIALHQDPVLPDCEITHAIQAGPMLLPDLNLEKEVFAVKKDGKIVKQSAGALSKYPRSALGIKDNHLLIVAVSKDNPMTLEELANFMKTLKVDKAMALDGGSSTSLYVNIPQKTELILNSAKDNYARKVKSALILKK